MKTNFCEKDCERGCKNGQQSEGWRSKAVRAYFIASMMFLFFIAASDSLGGVAIGCANMGIAIAMGRRFIRDFDKMD
ncbi:MAG: hypothetical protein ACI382_01000 [Alloprevotella sp.]